MVSYTNKQRAEIISKVTIGLNNGASLSSLAKEYNVPKATLFRWLNNKNKVEQDGTSNTPIRRKTTEEFLEEMKQDQEDIIRLASQRVKETISEAPPQVASNILNTATNNYRVSCGKSSEIIEVRDWASFIEDLKNGRVDGETNN